ncbi:sulfotransferase [Desulfobacterales bacterium HSG17]|nr:sulfotransferase [Desulfobacterales bacterium HSG17]
MRFIFLLYVSRSGSTMLSRQLDLHSLDLIVLPEFRLMELLLAKGDYSIRNMNKGQLMNFIKLDHQLSNLGFNNEDLEKIIQDSVGKGIKILMENISSCYCIKCGIYPKMVMIKNGGLLFLLDKLNKLFSDALYIHIYRDPRAVVNSMIHTISPYFRNEKMGRNDVVYAARSWLKYMKLVENIKKSISIIEVKYEELCLSGNVNILREIIENLGVSYIEPHVVIKRKKIIQVGKKEKKIHKLAKKSPSAKRIDSWKTELTLCQGVAIETIVHEKLSKFGYQKWFCMQSGQWKKNACYMKVILIHCYKTIRYFYNRIFHYIDNINTVPIRFKLFVVRKRK